MAIRGRFSLNSFLQLGLCTVLSAGLAVGQSYYGGLRGLIQDQSGAAVANAKVTLIDEASGATRSTISNSDGEYVFSQVVPSAYTISCEAASFKKFDRKGVAIATQQQIQVDLKLELGQVTETVQVNEEVPLIEASSASQGQVIDRQKLVDLPNLGRNPFMMSKVAQNVTPVGNPAYNRMQDQSGSSQISIAGGPVRGNNYLLDGIPITDASNRAIIIPTLEAVQEVKIQANTYDAEMARTGGGMFNTFLKSGENSFHGSLFGYMRQTDWLANNFFNNRAGLPITDQPFRNFGASLGGPISIPKLYDGRNRTFFWAAIEGYQDTQSNTQDFYTPTALERVGDFSQSKAKGGGLQTIYDPLNLSPSGARTPFANNIIPKDRLNQVGLNIAATYVMPTRTAAYYGDPNVTGPGKLPSKANQKTFKVDHQMTKWWRASASYLRYYSLEPGDTFFPTISSPGQWRLERRVDSTQVNNLLTLSPTTVMTVRYGFNRFPNYGFQVSQGFNPSTLGFSQAFTNTIASPTFPNIGMNTAYSLGTNNNFYYVHHSKNFSSSLSKYAGRHSVKLGFDYRRIHADGLDFGDSAGNFQFNDGFTRADPSKTVAGTGADIASLVMGVAASGSAYIPTKLYDYADYYAMFVQDDFRLNSKLTLNFGLRWEREYGLREVNNGMIVGFDRQAVNPLAANVSGILPKGAVQFAGINGNPETVGNPTMNKWGPRIGLAWQLNSKTTIRGGYGIYWAPQFAVGAPLNPEGYTASTPYVASNDGGNTPAQTITNPFPNGVATPKGNTLGDATGNGKSISLVDPSSRSPRVQQYSIDIQRELPGNVAFELAYVGSRTSDLVLGTANLNINALNPSYFSMGATALTSAVSNPFYQKGGTGVIGASTVSQSQLLKPYPTFDAVNLMFSDQNKARYDSMVVKGQKRFSHGMTFLATWTFSKTYDASSGGAGNFLNGGAVGPQNPYDMKSEYSLSNISTPHRVSIAGTYELPFGTGKAMLNSNKMLNYFVGGWSVNAVTVFQTGFPLQIKQDSNNNGTFGFASQRPNATGVSPETSGSLSSRLDSYINAAAFSPAARATFGNVSRTIGMRGPGQANWDLSVFKTVNILEKYKAQFRAEALNAMNTPLFTGPNTAVGNSTFGKITSQANFSRMIQLGVRFYF